MTNNDITDLHAARVLAFTRAEAILKALVIDIDNLKSSLVTSLTNCDETLASQLAQFRNAATDEWLKGSNAGLGAAYYDHARHAAIGRARSLERRALAAAEAAQALAFVLENTEPLVTADDLATRIDDVAGQFYDGHYSNDAAAEGDLLALWHDLAASPVVTDAAVEQLRRRYDAKITGPYPGNGLPNLYATVTDWRENYLSSSVWDAPMWDYAVATLRSWDEALGLWAALGDQRRGDIAAAQNVRLRTAIARRVEELATPKARETNPALFELAEAVTEFNNAHMWMLTRVRSAETMHDLRIVSDALAARGHDAEHALIALRALARKYDALTTSAPDADPQGDEWHPAAILHTRVNLWRAKTYRNALECTDARGPADLTEEDRYRLLDCALADARHTGHTGNVNNLLDRIDRIAAAGAEHILTADHIEKLRAGFAQNDTAAININGGTH